jgi:hypothetical protein
MRYSAFLIVVLWAFSGCSSSPQQVAKLRALLDPGANTGPPPGQVPPPTVTIDGATVVFPQLTCPSSNQACTMDYLAVPAGGFKFGAHDPGGSGNALPSQFQTLSLAPSTQNTFVYLGASSELLLDDATPAAGSAKLRFANFGVAMACSSPVSVWVNSNGSTTGNPTIRGVTGVAVSGYVSLPPGPYVVTSGCTLSGVQFDIAGEPITLVANQNVTVYVFVNYLLGTSTLILADN